MKTLLILYVAAFAAIQAADVTGRTNLASRESRAASRREARERAAVEKAQREQAKAERLASELTADRRRPTKADVSGVWSTGPNLVGRDFQLVQTGKKVSGRGFHWGCLGCYSVFAVNGTRDGETLVLSFTEPGRENEIHRLNYTEEDNYPRFHSSSAKAPLTIRTQYEIEERNAEEAKREPKDGSN